MPGAPVVQRAVAAVVGGYVLAVAFSIVVAACLPLPRFDAVMTAVLLSFVVYLAVILWAFAVRSLRTMWRGVLLSTAVLGGVIWWLYIGSAS